MTTTTRTANNNVNNHCHHFHAYHDDNVGQRQQQQENNEEKDQDHPMMKTTQQPQHHHVMVNVSLRHEMIVSLPMCFMDALVNHKDHNISDHRRIKEEEKVPEEDEVVIEDTMMHITTTKLQQQRPIVPMPLDHPPMCDRDVMMRHWKRFIIERYRDELVDAIELSLCTSPPPPSSHLPQEQQPPERYYDAVSHETEEDDDNNKTANAAVSAAKTSSSSSSSVATHIPRLLSSSASPSSCPFTSKQNKAAVGTTITTKTTWLPSSSLSMPSSAPLAIAAATGRRREEKGEERINEFRKHTNTAPHPHDSMLQKRLEVLNRVAQVQREYLEAKGPKVVYGELMQGVLDLMNCEFGFIGEMKYDAIANTQYMHNHSTATKSLNPSIVNFFHKYSHGLKFYNFDTLFGHVLTSKEPLISNNPTNDDRSSNRKHRGCPVAHPKLRNFLGIPFFRNDNAEVMGMIALANKQCTITGRSLDFVQDDISFLEPFTLTAANLVQAYLQVEANEVLMETVKVRTQTLERLNRDLALANQRVMAASAEQLKHFACMSHEIRTPLNCIIGMSSLLLENSMNHHHHVDNNNHSHNYNTNEGISHQATKTSTSALRDDHKLSPLQQESLQMVVTAGDLLLTVVNDVLDYSKLQSGNVEIIKQSTSLQDVLNATVHSIEMKGSHKNIVLRTYYDSSVPQYVTTDSRRLQQILFNLLGNSMKFSPPNCFVDVKVQLVKKTQDDNDMMAPRSMSDASMNYGASLWPEGQVPSITTNGYDKSSLRDTNVMVSIMGLKADDDTYRSGNGQSQSSPTVVSSDSEDSSDANDDLCDPSDSDGLCGLTAGFEAFPSHLHRLAGAPSAPAVEVIQSKIQQLSQDNPMGKEATIKNNHNLMLRLQVKDYGVGIAKKDYDRIFQPFSQATAETERVFGGTGLGLAITSRLVMALGGSISVDSEEGKWTEFTVDLPFEDEPVDTSKIIRRNMILDKNVGGIYVVDATDTTMSYISQTITGNSDTDSRDTVTLLPLHYFSTLEKFVDFAVKYDEPTTDVMRSSLIQTFICLINEDSFHHDTFQKLVEQTSSRHQFVLITFGPKFSVKEAKYHFRKPDRVLPTVFLEILASVVPKKARSRSLLGSVPHVTPPLHASGPGLRRRLSFTSSSRIAAPVESDLDKELRILIAEDNKINQKVLCRILDRMGMKNIDVVDDGKQAVEQERKKVYDLIFMDMQMPVMDGVEATKLILHHDSSLLSSLMDSDMERGIQSDKPKIAFVTAHAEPYFEQQCVNAGAVGFITKPFSVQDIETLIHRLFVKKQTQ